ncbi:MAG: cysteine hydrolase [Chloroflexota bacterium]|nr:cysteine hydrolase [Chloroflexota bacterium]
MEDVPLQDLGSLAGPKQTAVVSVDVQRIFTGLPLYPPVDQVLGNLGRFLNESRAFGVPVVIVRIIVAPEVYSSVWQRQFPRHDATWLTQATRNVEYEPGFEPREGDVVLTKHRYSAFIDTPLETILRTRSIRTVVVAGLTTDVCVGSTARDAFQRDFHVITLADCCAEMTRARHEAALETLADNFGTVCTSPDLVALWRSRRPSAPPEAASIRTRRS